MIIEYISMLRKITIGISLLSAVLMLTGADLVDHQTTAVATNLELFGGQPEDIVVDPNNGQYVYVATYTPNGVFSSSDSGLTWNSLPVDVDYGAGKAITIDPNTGDVYATVGDDLITSTDHGNTWTSLTDNLVGELPLVGSALAFTDATLVVAIDNGAVEVSQDSGEQFSLITLESGTRNDVISIAGDGAGTFYAVLQNADTNSTKLFVSTDNAVSWAQLDAPDSAYYGISIDPLDTDHLILPSYHPDYNSYQSFDGGATWTALLNNGLHIGAQKAVFDGSGGLFLGINYTSDASVAEPIWSEINTDTPLSSVRGDIYAVDMTQPTTVYSNTALGVAKSENTGVDWIDSVDGIQAVQTYAIAQSHNKDTVWLGANGGLAKTTNFTADHPDWEYPILPEDNASSIYAVWVMPSDSDYVVTGSSNFFYYSENGGDSWTQAVAPDFSGTVNKIVASPSNDAILYAMYTNNSLSEDGIFGGIMKSADVGQTWEDLAFPSALPDGDLAIALQDGGDVLYVGIGLGGSETGIYEYQQGDWSKLDADFNEFGLNNLLVNPEDNTIIFASFEAASTAGSLYKSSDAGATWKQLTNGLSNTNHIGVMAAQTTDTTTLYLAGQDDDGGDGMLYKSTDGGNSWSEYYRGKKQEFFYTLLFDGLVSGNDRGIFDLKSLGQVGLKAHALGGHRYRMTVTLKDAATKQKLVKKSVILYKKRSGHSNWKAIATIKTNSHGKITQQVKAQAGDKVKAVWKPKPADRAEYTRSTSSVFTTI